MPTGRSKQVIRISLLLCAMYALLAARLYHVQVTESDRLSEIQKNYQTRSRYLIGSAAFERPARGSIFDRNEKLLAVGFDTYRLQLDMYPGHRPRTRGDKPLTIQQRIHILSGVLNDLDVEHSVLAMLEKAKNGTYKKILPNGESRIVSKRGIFLVKGITPFQRHHIQSVMKKLRIVNFGFVAEKTRRYPYGSDVAEVVGFVGQNEKSGDAVFGQAGIERRMNELLASHEGRFTCEKDGHGRELELTESWSELPEAGYDVHLTIDVDLQKITGDALIKVCKQFACKTGAAVILDSNTGEILAARSFPEVSMEAIQQKLPHAAGFRCRPFSDIYVPGSTIKPLLVAKAIEAGIVGWLDRFDTNNGARVFRTQYHSRLLHDSHPHGVLSVEEIVIQSSNIGMAMIGFEKMGYSRLLAAFDELGFNEQLRVRMPAVTRSKMPKLNNKRPIYPGVSASFGHAMSLSPLQLTGIFNILATGGIYHEPRLVSSVSRDEDVFPNKLCSKRLLEEGVADDSLDILERAVEEGTGKVLKNLPWRVGAKTGTARRMGSPTRSFNSSMIAIAPVANPRITVYVGLYDVRGKVVTGGQTAGHALREILEQALTHLNVTPDREIGGK